MYDKILHAQLRFGAHIQPDSKAILTGLLQRQVDDRLGSKGPQEIMDQAFFKDVDFDKVFNKEYPPEFKPPNSHGDLDTSNFDLEFTSERPEDSHVTQNMTEEQIEKSKFTGFTYQEPGAMD